MKVDLENLKHLVTIRDILREVGAETRKGRCKCPLHDGKNRTSFSFNDSTFYCFSCGAKGDVITLVQMLYGLDFKDAVIYLGRKAGILDCEIEAKKLKIQPVIPDTEKLLDEEIDESFIFLEKVYIRLLKKCDNDLKEGRMKLADYYSRVRYLDYQLGELDQLKLERNLMKQKKMRRDAFQGGNKRNLLKGD